MGYSQNGPFLLFYSPYIINYEGALRSYGNMCYKLKADIHSPNPIIKMINYYNNNNLVQTNFFRVL